MTATERAFPVTEIFGPTIQGEGPDAGSPCHFVRFGGCDYRCGFVNGKRVETLPFMCDSLHSVLPEHVRVAPKMTQPEIFEKLIHLGVGNTKYVVLSGGNPALHDVSKLVADLQSLRIRVSVETQGTRWQAWLDKVDTLVVSPKPPSAGQPFSIPVLDRFTQQVTHGKPKSLAMKVPIFDDADLQFANTIAERYCRRYWRMYLSVVNAWVPDQNNPPLEASWLRENLLRQYEWIIENAQRYKHLQQARVFPQIHVLVWGEEKGR